MSESENTGKYAYLVRTTVRQFGFLLEDTAWGDSADEVADKVYSEEHHVSVDVAPAAPVNGYREANALPHKSGDTAFRGMTRAERRRAVFGR